MTMVFIKDYIDTGRFITESPQLSDPDTFGLDNESKNKAMLVRLEADKVSVLEQGPVYELFETKKGPNRFIVLKNKNRGTIDYMINHIAVNTKPLGKTVTQVKLWRNMNSPGAAGITKRMFYDVLLKRFGTIVSDRIQTVRGKEFWIIRLAESTGLGFKVGLLDETKKIVKWFDPKHEDYQDWIGRMETEGWGLDDHYADMRFVITRKM